MTDYLPKISVVIPSFNQGKFIKDSLDSIISQEYPNIEIIIIDAGSTDDTLPIVQSYNEYIKIFVVEPDKGQSDALNKGFKLATGDIFGWLNTDDVYLSRALWHVGKFFSKCKTAEVVYGDWVELDLSGQTRSVHYAFDFDLNHLKYEGFLCNAQAMFWRRGVHQKFSGFKTNLHYTMDYQMMIEFGHICAPNSIHRINVPLGGFRRHAEQKTQGLTDQVIDEHMYICSLYDFCDKYTFFGFFKRLFYRFRRLYWYLLRGGFIYTIKLFLR